MICLSKRTLVAGLLVSMVAGSASPALATKADQAVALCRQRGSDCKALKIHDDNTVVVVCVNNSSSGNGIQCVSCQEGQDCTVLHTVPDSGRGNRVNGILTNKPEKRQ